MLGLVISGLFIALYLSGLFPLSLVNFAFWSVFIGLACLYRPNWCFLLLLALLPLETVNLLPETFGAALRPYQWLCLLLVGALAFRVLSKRSTWPLFTLHPIDSFLFILVLGSFVSGIVAGGAGIRLAVIITSFYALYLLSRVFFKTVKDIALGTTVFVISSFSALIYGVMQNVSFERGGALMSVMPGRPNATYAEPDWLGFFTAALLLFVVTALLRSLRSIQAGQEGFFPKALLQALALIPIATVLIISVSRSAWLAALIGLFTWCLTLLLCEGRNVVRPLFQTIELAVIAFIIALFIAVELPLTRFDLLHRAESTATGLQTITIACTGSAQAPETINDVAELASFGCRHINLEEREAFASAGQIITTTKRPDPNVAIRSVIYERTWDEIKAHPVIGIGWGNIGAILGVDENGAAYNASNLWLEAWLGAGLLGVLAFFLLFSWVAFQTGKIILKKISTTDSGFIATSLAVLSVFFIFNLFNAGLLIGFVWVFLAMLPIMFPARLPINIR